MHKRTIEAYIQADALPVEEHPLQCCTRRIACPTSNSRAAATSTCAPASTVHEPSKYIQHILQTFHSAVVPLLASATLVQCLLSLCCFRSCHSREYLLLNNSVVLLLPPSCMLSSSMSNSYTQFPLVHHSKYMIVRMFTALMP
jgi:hypothetical protein